MPCPRVRACLHEVRYAYFRRMETLPDLIKGSQLRMAIHDRHTQLPQFQPPVNAAARNVPHPPTILTKLSISVYVKLLGKLSKCPSPR